MTDANYIRHFKVLGKLAKLYDASASSVEEANTLLATTGDQIATGLVEDNPAMLLFSGYANSLQSAINTGPSNIQSMCRTIAGQYLQLPLFVTGLTTVPATTSVADIAAALATEMTSVDTKTITTKTTAGLANFLDVTAGTTGAWNTAADGAADYKDSVYCVDTIV